MGAWLARDRNLSESLALGDRRVGIGPENNKRRRVRILERFLPQALERLGIYLLGIGNDAMDHLDSEDIRLMLLIAADAVGDGLGEERKDRTAPAASTPVAAQSSSEAICQRGP